MKCPKCGYLNPENAKICDCGFDFKYKLLYNTGVDNVEKIPGVYTNKIISLATYLGGPLAAGFLIGHNYKVFGNEDKARYSRILGGLSTLILFELMFLIPENIIDSVPRWVIPSLYAGIVYFIVFITQEQRINEFIKVGGHKASGWRAAGIGLICLIFVLGYIFIRTYERSPFEGEVMTFSNANHEIYYNKEIPEADIKIIGHELTTFGYFKAVKQQRVRVALEDGTYCLKIIVRKDWWEDQDVIESLKQLEKQISNSLNNQVLKIKMLDSSINGFEEKNIN
jgi:hypothetical protein